MLAQLSIQNILLIKSCAIHFTRGLNTLTGETGAGKSILLDALGLVLGERSEAGLVRAGEAQASVTAAFDISENTTAQHLLETLGIAAEAELVLRRTLTAEGKSRAFVNDAPVTVTTLKRLGEVLIARHGQHDQRGLLDSKTHRALLDQLAHNQPLLKQAATAFAAWKAATARAAELEEQAVQAAREEDWLRGTVKELGALDPQEGEEEQLSELRKRASDMRATTSALRETIQLLTESEGVALQLRQAMKLLAKTPNVEEALTAALERAESEVEEVSVALERKLAEADIDPRAIEQAEDRLHALRAAARKYNIAVALLPGLLADAQAKLTTLTNLDAERRAAAANVTQAHAAYRDVSMALHEARASGAEKLTKAVMKELKPLKMATTQLRVVQTELPPQSWGAEGMHQVAFEVATNAGMPFGALSKVASGGELSRLLLAMKVVLQTEGGVTSIFDEIDAGTGGAVAEAIGLRLKNLADNGQVIVVTHLPQVAALAAHHLYITKSGAKEVTTNVKLLDLPARKEELARMLSGATISDEARKTAAKLLEGAA